MRIITIGRSSTSNICLSNDYVSSEHAELLLLDSGDIFLTDKNSRNGTYLFGKRIQPNVDVPVSRGDKIDFAGVPLNWSSIPTITLPDPSVVKGIYGIGKNPSNRYCLTGEFVSRYHATLKEMKNGKWYIQDHSTNGTFVNGQRIPSNQDFQIKKGDTIVCGKDTLPNPVQGSSVPWTAIAISVLAAACIAGLVYLLPLITSGGGGKFDPSKAVVKVITTFDIEGFKIKNHNEAYYFFEKWDGTYGVADELSKDRNSYSLAFTGTAFFVSENGILLTNHHVSQPWVFFTGDVMSDLFFNKLQLNDNVMLSLLDAVGVPLDNLEDLEDDDLQNFRILMGEKLRDNIELIIGGTSYFVMYPGQKYTSIHQMGTALIQSSGEGDIDICALKLREGKTPEGTPYFHIKSAISDVTKLDMNSQYYSVGYPHALSEVHDGYEEQNPTNNILHLAQTPDKRKNRLTLQGDASLGGQSGSPVYDKKNRLIGVLTEVDVVGKGQTYVVPIRYGLELLNNEK